MFSVLKLETIELIKFSRIITARIDFQSEAFSPSNKQIDSNAVFKILGGFCKQLHDFYVNRIVRFVELN